MNLGHVRDVPPAEVDFHPLRRTPDGGGDQVQLDGVKTYHYEPPVVGSIAGKTAACCSVEDQVRCHRGYEPTAKDRTDMGELARVFGIELPEPYA